MAARTYITRTFPVDLSVVVHTDGTRKAIPGMVLTPAEIVAALQCEGTIAYCAICGEDHTRCPDLAKVLA